MADRSNSSQGPQDPRIPRPPQDATPSAPQQPAPAPTREPVEQPTLIVGQVVNRAAGPVPQQPPAAPSAQQQPPWQQQTVRAQPPAYPQQPQPQPQSQQPTYGQVPYQQQGFPATGYASPNEPDWSALAERQEEAARKKRRRNAIIGGAVAVVLVGAGAAFALGAFKSSPAKPGPVAVGTPTASASVAPTTASAAPTASPSAPASASVPAKPTGNPPLDAATVLNAKTRQINGKTYTRKATDTTDTCWKATGGGLGNILSKQNCAQVLRATYVSGTSAVTVAVAVFHDRADASAADQQNVGNVAPLYGGTVGPFCQKTACALTHAVHGRFDYFTIAGPTGNGPGVNDSDSIAAGHGFAGYALSRLMTIN